MVKLLPMTQTDFETFLERDIREYAKENVRAGYWSEAEALKKSLEEHARLLPDGLKSKDHYLFTIYDAQEAVGIIWMKANFDSPKPSGFIFDLEIDEKFRHKGYATQAMLQLEEFARGLGLRQLALHVFAYNRIARTMYEKLDYQVSSLNMLKELHSSK